MCPIYSISNEFILVRMDGYGLHFIDLSNHTTAFMQAASFNFFCFFSKKHYLSTCSTKWSRLWFVTVFVLEMVSTGYYCILLTGFHAFLRVKASISKTVFESVTKYSFRLFFWSWNLKSKHWPEINYRFAAHLMLMGKNCIWSLE